MITKSVVMRRRITGKAYTFTEGN